MRNDRIWRVLRVAVVAGAGLSWTSGCSLLKRDPEPEAFNPDQFAGRRVEGRQDPQPVDHPGQVITEGVNPPVDDDTASARRPQPTRVQSVNDISPAVREAARPPAPAVPAAAPDQTAPAAAQDAGPTVATATRADAPGQPALPTTMASQGGGGQYIMLGKVLAQVNGRPIYAHKVLAVLDNALRAEAQRYDERNFRRVAADLIVKEIQTEVQEERIFAVAEKALDQREKEMAQILTAQWQKDQETAAGGSLELAKRKWADEGWDFDERLDYQYRVSMKLVYLQRRVNPLLHVSASDIRRYYEANRTTEFTKSAMVKFRVIRIDPRKMSLEGGLDGARQLAERIRVKAFKGDFAQLARETNDEGLKLTAGLVGGQNGWLPKGSYVSEKLEDAVWKLKPGEVTEVVEDKGAYYVAKLEDRQDAVTQEFEDVGLQQEIEGKLRAQQIREFETRRLAELSRERAVQENPNMMEIALDMAMQRYPAWAAAGKRTSINAGSPNEVNK